MKTRAVQYVQEGTGRYVCLPGRKCDGRHEAAAREDCRHLRQLAEKEAISVKQLQPREEEYDLLRRAGARPQASWAVRGWGVRVTFDRCELTAHSCAPYEGPRTRREDGLSCELLSSSVPAPHAEGASQRKHKETKRTNKRPTDRPTEHTANQTNRRNTNNPTHNPAQPITTTNNHHNEQRTITTTNNQTTNNQ